MTRPRWKDWTGSAGRALRAVGDFQARILVAAAFAVLVVPYALVLRLARPAARRRGGWFDVEPGDGSIDRMRRMF